MKKIIALALSAILILSLSSCGAPSPTDAANNFLTALKTQDQEAITAAYEGDDFTFGPEEMSEMLSEGGDESEDIFSGIADEFVTKLLDFDYEVTNEVIDGDKATVDVNITTYEFGSGFTKFFNEYISQAFMLMWDDDADSKLDKLSETMLQSMVSDLKEKTYTGTATLNLKKVDDNWVVEKIEDDSDFVNVLSGGMYKAVEAINDTWGDE